MPELVKDGFHFAMRQQRRLAADGRRQIAADQPKVRLCVREARDEAIHPGSAALVFARIEIGVKRPEQRVRTLRPESCNISLPDPRPARRFLALTTIPNTRPKMANIPSHDALQRKIRTQRLFVEIVERGALLLGVVGDVPGSIAGASGPSSCGEIPGGSDSPGEKELPSSRADRPETPARVRRCAPCDRRLPDRQNRRSPEACAFSRRSSRIFARIARLSNFPDVARTL